ncbi:unnamed protein product [Blepharisma stoltei]|uniref:Peptidase S11 D-alanyl-D-alanine carboxypeptidase A N-terminal domain-containing protein n=1 Tax=Blepharisma stoltei TaxID=1481888 RepID=A0AAU9IU01_9CILI|nr:unnamed protein product [Blepharisma stoltei]
MDNSYSALKFRSLSPAAPISKTKTSRFPKLGLQKTMEKNLTNRLSLFSKKSSSKAPLSALTASSIEKIRNSEEMAYQRNIHKPRITAQSWIVLDGKKGKLLDGKDFENQREIASLTKIMTCYVAVEEINSRGKSFEEYATISKEAAAMTGTSASLQVGDEIKLWDLLHGLMLPSGNDAAIVIAEHIGRIIDPLSINPIQSFTKKMNETCKALKLNSTYFTNPHGLSNSLNISTAKNIAILSYSVMKVREIKKIVQTESYRCIVKNGGNDREIVWLNTNRLLKFGFSGIKTGYTPGAGPCLCCYVEKRKTKRIIVLLNSVSMESRWSEGLGLWRWSSKYF